MNECKARVYNETRGERTSDVTYDTSEDEQKRCSGGRW